MELLDRGKQRALLGALADGYPQIVQAEQLLPLAPGNALNVNIAYLSEHNLVTAHWLRDLEHGNQLAWARATAAGLDFLADDGGLGAILNVVTVRLHQETVRALLIRRVKESDGDDTTKGKMIDKLKGLPADTLGTLTQKALEAGVNAIPNVLQWLQTVQWS